MYSAQSKVNRGRKKREGGGGVLPEDTANTMAETLVPTEDHLPDKIHVMSRESTRLNTWCILGYFSEPPAVPG